MDLIVMDSDFNPVCVIDEYESAIWTDRYCSFGDFELYLPITNDILNYIKRNYYLINKSSEHVMIIDTIEMVSDFEDGNRLIVTGRSLESILNRRIIWSQTNVSDGIQEVVKKLINENIISPTNEDRKISNFVFESNSSITSTDKIDRQYTGDNLYDAIQSLCKEKGIGFKITLDDNNRFVFKLYQGVNRSYEQNQNAYVVFSPNFDNISNSKYIESSLNLKNVALVGGEGEGDARKYATSGTEKGLNRRELFVDARSVSSNTTSGTSLSADDYASKLEQIGAEKLSENKETSSFDGEAETETLYKYGKDFFNGDIVQIADEYGHETSARITEVIMSESNEGSFIYPTFENTKEGE